MGTRGCNRRNLVLASWAHISWQKAPWHRLQSAHLMVGNGGREGTNLPDVYDKACWGPFGCFSCLFFFFYFLSYRQNCPNYFSNCTLRRDYSSPKGLAFYMLQTWLHLLHWKNVKFQTHASIPGVHSAHRKCVRQWLLNLHFCQKGQGRGRTVNWKQEAGDGAKIKSKGYVGCLPFPWEWKHYMETLESWSYSSIKF